MKMAVIHSLYLFYFIIISFIIIGIFALDGPPVWDFLRNLNVLIPTVWISTTLIYNFAFLKLSNYKNTHTNKYRFMIICTFSLPSLILILWQWQRIYYDNYVGDPFLVFHPALVLAIALFCIYEIYCVFIITLRFIEIKNRIMK